MNDQCQSISLDSEENPMNDFLRDFHDFDADFKCENEEIDHEWVAKFFGRKPKDYRCENFKAHLDERFLESCKYDTELFDKFQFVFYKLIKINFINLLIFLSK